MSAIREAYRHLAAQPVSVQNITPQVYDLHELPSFVAPALLPCRLLLPYNPRSELRDGSFVALGKMAMVTWRITDLMLWRPSGSGIGIEDIAETLVSYVANYTAMLRSNRAMGQAQMHITGFRITYGQFTYPDDASPFDGVSVDLTIEEVLSGC